MSWHRVGFEQHMTHMIPTQLLHPYMRSIVEDHGAKIFSPPTRIDEWRLDFGGMWVTGQPCERVNLRGLAIEVPSHHVDVAIKVFRRCMPEHEFGLVRYGIVHWHFALLLLPAQRHSLLAQLVAIAPAARERSAYHDDRVQSAREKLGRAGLMARAPEVN